MGKFRAETLRWKRLVWVFEWKHHDVLINII